MKPLKQEIEVEVKKSLNERIQHFNIDRNFRGMILEMLDKINEQEKRIHHLEDENITLN